jgi:hypothetical protein
MLKTITIISFIYSFLIIGLGVISTLSTGETKILFLGLQYGLLIGHLLFFICWILYIRKEMQYGFILVWFISYYYHSNYMLFSFIFKLYESLF